MAFAPRDYQLEAAEAFASHEGPRNGVIVLPTGTGKTVTGHLCALPYLESGQRVLWIAHTKELVTQPLATLNEKFPGFAGGVVQGKRDESSAQIVYASKDTISKPDRLGRILVHGTPALVVVDECFPAGTLVDGRPIETLSPGDKVWSVHHDDGSLARRKITRVSERVSQEVVTVWCGGRPTTCTPDHPFFVRGRGYVCAKDLVHGDLLCLRGPVRSGAEAGPAGAEVLPEDLSGQEVARQEELLGVWSRIPKGGATLAGDLLGRVPGGSALRGDGQHEQEARLQAYVGEQSDVAAGRPGVGLPETEGDRSRAEGARGEREGSDQVRGATAGGPGRRVGWELHRDDRPAQGKRVSALLQAGSGVPGDDDLCGGGRFEPRHERAQGAGPKEGGVLVWTRVDRVQSQEPGSAGGTLVYNIEVEGAHTYFANDVLVHNCHHGPADSWKRTIDQLKAAGAKVLGLTATPERGDAKPMSIDWEIVYSLPIIDAIEMGALVPPYAAVDMVAGFDPTKVKITRGEYDAADLDTQLREHIIEHTVNAVQKVHTWSRLPLHNHDVTTSINGSVIIYTPTVALGELTVAALLANGFDAAVVWGEMGARDRKQRIADFLAGKLRILVNACMLVEGTDLPITEAVVIAMPVRKRGRYMQIVGRCVRLFEGKERGLVLDLCGASKEHSIVSAPVIISGTDCDVSTDGQHHYEEIVGTREGRCKFCEKVVRCYQCAGPHRFKSGKCSKCGADQCSSSPTKEHVYMVVADFTRGCVHCGIEVVDPLSRMAGRESKAKEKVAWKQLVRLPGEVWFVNLGRIGTLFNRRTESGWLPTLVDNDGMKPLSRTPVDERIARMLTDDVARRSSLVNGEFGGHKTPTAAKYACLKAEDLAKRLRL